MNDNFELKIAGPYGFLVVEPPPQAGEGEITPHRQYRIYSNDGIYSNDVPSLIFYPPVHNYYPDNDDNTDKHDTDNDSKNDLDNAPLPVPNPLPDASNNNDHHAYQNPSYLSPNPILPSLPSLLPLPDPLARSFGGSSRGKVRCSIDVVDGPGALPDNSNSYSWTNQTTAHANYRLPANDGSSDSELVKDGVTVARAVPFTALGIASVSDNSLDTTGDHQLPGVIVCVDKANNCSAGVGDNAASCENENHTVTRSASGCIKSTISNAVLRGSSAGQPPRSTALPTGEGCNQIAEGNGLGADAFLSQSTSYNNITEILKAANHTITECASCDNVSLSANEVQLSQGTSTCSSDTPNNLNLTITEPCLDPKCIKSTCTNNTLLPALPLYVVKDESSLNRSDLEEVHRHENILDAVQRRQLSMVEKKIKKNPQRYDRDNYLQHASFLILSKWPSAQRLAYCGIPSLINRSGRCRLHQFCPYCCWRERNQAQLAFVPNYHDGTWHFLTGSFTGDLLFTGNDGFDWLHYWDAYKYGLSCLVDEGLIDGAYWTEELAVNSFMPTRVLPHVHCIIDAFELTDTTIELLKDKVNEHLQKNLGPDFMQPNIKAASIQDQKAFFDRIGYMLKPIKLLKAYERAWAGASYHNRARVWDLNSQLTDLIRGHSEITRRRPKMRAKGTLDSRTKGFIGVLKGDRSGREHQQLINELKRQPVEFIQDVNEEEGLDLVA